MKVLLCYHKFPPRDGVMGNVFFFLKLKTQSLSFSRAKSSHDGKNASETTSIHCAHQVILQPQGLKLIFTFYSGTYQ